MKAGKSLTLIVAWVVITVAFSTVALAQEKASGKGYRPGFHPVAGSISLQLLRTPAGSYCDKKPFLLFGRQFM